MGKLEDFVLELADNKNLSEAEFIDVLMQAPELRDSTKDELPEWYEYVGQVLYHECLYKHALSAYETAFRLFWELGAAIESQRCRSNIAMLYSTMGRYRDALKYQHAALAFYQSDDSPLELAHGYSNLGLTYYRMGNLNEAEENFEKAIEIYIQLEDFCNIAETYMNIGNVRSAEGDYHKALDYNYKALEILHNAPNSNQETESSCFCNIAATYIDLADYSQAIGIYRALLESDRQMGDKDGELADYINLGICNFELNNYPKAIECYKQALNLAEAQGDLTRESMCYTNLGILHVKTDEFKKALEYSGKALEIDREIGDPAGEVYNLFNIGNAYHQMKRYPEAVKHYKTALAANKKINDPDHERMIYLNLAQLYGDHLSDDNTAYNYLKESIKYAEKTWNNLVRESHKIGYAARILVNYENMVTLCARMGKITESLAAVEQGKSRAFLGLLAVGELPPTIKNDKNLASLLKEEAECLKKMRSFKSIEFSDAIPYWQEGEMDLLETDDITEHLNSVYDRLSAIDPEYVSLRRAVPLNFEELKSYLAS